MSDADVIYTDGWPASTRHPGSERKAIYRWVEGQPYDPALVDDGAAAGAALARFVEGLRSAPLPTDAPPGGRAPLASLDGGTRGAIAACAPELGTNGVEAASTALGRPLRGMNHPTTYPPNFRRTTLAIRMLIATSASGGGAHERTPEAPGNGPYDERGGLRYLPDGELTPGLHAVRRREAKHRPDAWPRAVMR